MESADDCSIIYSTLADLARFEYVAGETLQITEENSENLYEEEQQFKCYSFKDYKKKVKPAVFESTF